MSSFGSSLLPFSNCGSQVLFPCRLDFGRDAREGFGTGQLVVFVMELFVTHSRRQPSVHLLAFLLAWSKYVLLRAGRLFGLLVEGVLVSMQDTGRKIFWLAPLLWQFSCLLRPLLLVHFAVVATFTVSSFSLSATVACLVASQGSCPDNVRDVRRVFE